MNIRVRAAAIAVAAAGALGLGVLGAGSAFAGTGMVTAVTHTMNHPDTTSVSGSCTGVSANGPVWALDNLSLRLVATPEDGPGNYSVTIYAHGSFNEFADPNTGGCATGRGSVDGWLRYDVQSSTPPDPANVPAQQPDGTTGQTTILLDQLFGGNAITVGSGHYSYTYTRVDGTKYQQNG